MKDKREKLYDSLTNVREDFVEEAQGATSAKRPAWVRWCALAACLCLLVVGTVVWKPWSPGENKPASPPTSAAQTAKGITIPKAEVTLSQPDGVAMDMLAFFIYQGRCYLQYDRLDHGSDLVGEKVGTATGLIDEWTPAEGYVELAGSVSGDFYTVRGFDPAFMLCMKEEGDAVQLFVCNNGITLYQGSELFEDRLGLSDGLKAVTYEDEDSWYNGKEDIHTLNNLDAIKTLIAAMDEAAFQLSDQADLYEEKKDGGLNKELYHVYCKLDNGVTVTLCLFQGGYVTFTGLPDACVQVPEATFDAFLAALK